MADKNDGRIRAWDDTAKEWKLVDRGVALPLSPENGDYFQLTDPRRPDRGRRRWSQDVTSPTELKVKSTTGFRPAGTFTVAGVTGTCTYTAISGTTKFTGLSGCTGTPDDGGVVISTTGTTVNGGGQNDEADRHAERRERGQLPARPARSRGRAHRDVQYTSKTGTLVHGRHRLHRNPGRRRDPHVRPGAGHLQVRTARTGRSRPVRSGTAQISRSPTARTPTARSSASPSTRSSPRRAPARQDGRRHRRRGRDQHRR